MSLFWVFTLATIKFENDTCSELILCENDIPLSSAITPAFTKKNHQVKLVIPINYEKITFRSNLEQKNKIRRVLTILFCRWYKNPTLFIYPSITEKIRNKKLSINGLKNKLTIYLWRINERQAFNDPDIAKENRILLKELSILLL